MNTLMDWLASDSARNLLLALVHSLWIGGALALMLRVLPRRAGVRHGILLTGQLGMLPAVIFAWALLESRDAAPPAASPLTAPMPPASPAPERVRPAEAEAGSQASPGRAGGEFSASAPASTRGQWADRWPRLLGILYLAGVGICLSWRVYQHATTLRLLARSEPVAGGAWHEFLMREQERFQLARKVVLRKVRGLASPAAYGFMRPIILIPHDLLDTAEARIIRMILAHELAHLRRLDPVAQAIQQLIEALFFFNPFVWLLSHWISLEREAAADALAAKDLDPDDYSQSLVDLARRRGTRAMAAAAATGRGAPSQLRERIQRLLQPGYRPRYGLRPRGAILGALVAMASLMGMHQAAKLAAETLAQGEWMDRIEAVVQGPPVEQEKLWITGDILDDKGKPLEAITVDHQHRAGPDDGGDSLRWSTPATTFHRDFQLKRIHHMQGKVYTLEKIDFYFLAPGHDVRQVEVPFESGELELNPVLEPGLPAEVRVLDSAGAPVANARLSYDYLLRDSERPSAIASPEALITNRDGVAAFRAPREFPLRFHASAEGFLDLRDQEARFSPENTELILRMRAGPEIRGRVVDADSGEPISARIIYLGSQPQGHKSNPSWFDEEVVAVSGADGWFSTHALPEGPRHWLAAKAPGFLTTLPGETDGRAADRFGEAFSVGVGDEPPIFHMIPQAPLTIEITPPGGVDAETLEVGLRSRMYVQQETLSPWSPRLPLIDRTVTADGRRLLVTVEPKTAGPIEVKLSLPGRPQRILRGWDYGETPLPADFTSTAGADKTEVTVTVAPADGPPPRGSVVIHWQRGERAFNSRSVNLENGRATTYVDRLPGTPVTVFPFGMIGYYFAPRVIPPPEAETGAIPIQISDLTPAGAIRVEMNRNAGLYAAHLSLHALEKLPAGPDGAQGTNDYMTVNLGRLGGRPIPFQATPDRYPLMFRDGDAPDAVITPIPLDIPIVLTAYQHHTRFASEPITLTKDRRLVTVPVHMPEGVTFRGRILGKDGKPPSSGRVHLLYHPTEREGGGGFGGYYADINEDGRFAIPHVNPKVPGTYSLELSLDNGSRRIGQKLDVTKPFAIDLSKRLELRVKVLHEGAPVAGVAVEGFLNIGSGHLIFQALSNENGVASIHVTPPLKDNWLQDLQVRYEREIYRQKLPQVPPSFDQSPVSVTFDLTPDKQREPKPPSPAVTPIP